MWRTLDVGKSDRCSRTAVRRDKFEMNQDCMQPSLTNHTVWVRVTILTKHQHTYTRCGFCSCVIVEFCVATAPQTPRECERALLRARGSSA